MTEITLPQHRTWTKRVVKKKKVDRTMSINKYNNSKDSIHKWIPLDQWNGKLLQSKSKSKRIVCLYQRSMESIDSKHDSIRKCYQIKGKPMVIRNETMIINDKRTLNDDQRLSTTTTRPLTSMDSDGESIPNINLYEYQNENDATVSLPENGTSKHKEDSMAGSGSEQFPVTMTNHMTDDVERVTLPKKAKRFNSIVTSEGVNGGRQKDQWLINRRKKQLKSMTMHSKVTNHHYHNNHHRTNNDNSNVSSQLDTANSETNRRILIEQAAQTETDTINLAVNRKIPKLLLLKIQTNRERMTTSTIKRERANGKQRLPMLNGVETSIDPFEKRSTSIDERDMIEVSESANHGHRHRHRTSNELNNGKRWTKTKTKAKTRSINTNGFNGQWLSAIPKTEFDCSKRSVDGVYADQETGCQVWHVCQGSMQHSFLCPGGTIFNAKNGVCDWWYNAKCQ
ncbi:hypothetical protein RDWZM_010237 [Blomia tropicalis]|uniref:Chitin-binding type-2 domain-containing protein n=1 Tax=Blomia tropicalis TaxID=40697 RepID=A0A9Q0LYT5_BLOTA|nr:hypothetical protein RDWZM_010237 [Blomia tropicalis]